MILFFKPAGSAWFVEVFKRVNNASRPEEAFSRGFNRPSLGSEDIPMFVSGGVGEE
jgi:hypothetical protein